MDIRMKYIIPLLLLLSACSAEKRLQRLIEKNPQLQRTDTIQVAIAIPADTIQQATVIHTRDTVTVENERQVVRIVRVPTGSPCDTAAVALDLMAVRKPDTAYGEVYVDRIVPCPEGSRVHCWWRLAALFFALLCVALFLLIRYPAKK
jgi:hypothetical protein